MDKRSRLRSAALVIEAKDAEAAYGNLASECGNERQKGSGIALEMFKHAAKYSLR